MKYLIGACILLSAGAMVLGDTCPLPGYSTTFYPDYTNCSRYILCYAGVPTLMSCPDGLWWNQDLLTCDYPYDVDCRIDPTATTPPAPSTTSTTPAPAPSVWTPDPECPYPSDIITYDYYPGDCQKYYECDRGTRYVFKCPDGYLWNHVKNYCDLPDYVDCSRPDVPTTSARPTSITTPRTTTPASSPTTWAPDPQCPYPSDMITYDYYPGDCQKYYECDGGTRYQFKCPDGYLWNHIENYCDFPDYVDCSRSEVTTTNKCNSQPDGTLFASAKSCGQFIECIHGKYNLKDCPDGTWWDESRLTCDFPKNVNCKLTNNAGDIIKEAD